MDLLRKRIEQLFPLSDSAWEAFSQLLEGRKLAKGGYFCREGDFAREAALVKSGVMRAFFRDQEGNEYNKTFFAEGSLACSFASVLSQKASYLNFQALTDLDLLVFDYPRFAELFHQHRELESFIRRLLETKWVVAKEQREIRLVTTDATQRYLFFRQEYPGLENRIPQYHVASHLGITPIQLSRIRKKLKEKEES